MSEELIGGLYTRAEAKELREYYAWVATNFGEGSITVRAADIQLAAFDRALAEGQPPIGGNAQTSAP